MKFDDLLKYAWQGQTHSGMLQNLTCRVRRRQRRLRLLRTVEVVLTAIALLVFGQVLLSGDVAPAHWLLMPFFLVFLPIVWFIVMRAPRRNATDATASASSYALHRLAQLRTGLRDLWLARKTGWLLLAYAAVANSGVWLFAGDEWREAGVALLVMAVALLAATLWLSRTLRQHWLREYRAVRRLISG
jgi:Ca2+/Na+ antiporter